MGAKSATVSGLSGLGDIMLTCYGSLSRNRRAPRLTAALPAAAGLASGNGAAPSLWSGCGSRRCISRAMSALWCVPLGRPQLARQAAHVRVRARAGPGWGRTLLRAGVPLVLRGYV